MRAVKSNLTSHLGHGRALAKGLDQRETPPTQRLCYLVFARDSAGYSRGTVGSGPADSKHTGRRSKGATLMATEDAYVLGHSEAELKRLLTQARLIDPITRRFLVSAGIREGMRVLDVGSGVGDVAILLAGLVGQSGEIVGTDLARPAIDAAERRVRASSLANVTFMHGDPATMIFNKPFDAVVGRYVLQFIPDPSAAIARLSSHLRPGGVMFFP
jgi:2-polyprenyl-3-methyl-5-hydroxy-6-metoxy-1,4-benzoquinol methylase